MRKLFILSLLSLLYACNSSEEIKVVLPPFEFQNIPLKDKMKKAISKEYLGKLHVADSTYNYLLEFYSENEFQPKWINDSSLTTTGVKLKSLLKSTYQIGIPKNRLTNLASTNFIQDEILLNLSLAQIIHDLDSGLIDYSNKLLKPRRLISTERLQNIQFDESKDLRDLFLQFGPRDSTYSVLAKGLIDLVDNFPIDTCVFIIESIKYDTLFAFSKTREALLSKGYLLNNTKDSLEVLSALKQFQIDNGLKPDGVIGKYTSKALNESTYHKMERIILSMDKIRVRNIRPKKHIQINIPEYKLRLYINDSLKREHNIVVGKFENQTPELTSKLRKIVMYPYWNVPYSISSKEILPAVKRNVGYLEKHKYKIFKKDVEINPDSVNWSRIRQNAFPFKVRQEPGPHNALGIIKFDFYNTHSVYFHDTPSKSLFGVDVRAYSHGCMRTQNPIDLARAILERDEYRHKFNETISDSLDSIIARNNNYEIKLLDPIPIFIEYQTVTRFSERMVLYVDVYGRDEEYLKILRE